MMSKPIHVAGASGLFHIGGAASARVLGGLAGLAATLVVTAALGATMAGLVYGTMAWVAGLSILARWGASERVLVELPRHDAAASPESASAYFNRELAWAMARALALVAATGALWALAAAWDKAPAISLPFLAALLPASVLLQMIASAAKARGFVASALVFEFTLPPAVVLAAVGLAEAGMLAPGLALVAGAYVAGTLASALASFSAHLLARWKPGFAHPDGTGRRTSSNDLAITEIANFLNSWLPMLAIPLVLAPAAVGEFNVAFRLAGAIGLVGSTLYALLLPRLSAAHARRDLADWQSQVAIGRVVMAGVGILFFLAILTVGRFVLASLGEEFLSAWAALLVLSAGFALGIGLGPGGAILVAAGREASVRRITMAATGLALLLIGPAILVYGTLGAAAVTALTFTGLKGALLIAELRMQTGAQFLSQFEPAALRTATSAKGRS